MLLGNQTFLKEFIFVGFPEDMKICILYFCIFFLMYSLTLFGNIFVVVTVVISPKLHLPMYFFLCNLAILDLLFTSNGIPEAMINVFSKKRTISVTSCMVQMNTGAFIGGTESFLLAVMAYDRYMAILFPLHYTVIMNWRMCRYITIFMWLVSFFILIVPSNVRPMMFCGENHIDHFVCELLAVLDLACGDLIFHKLVRLVVSFITLVVPLVFIIVSYIFIISSILKIQSTGGRSKVFSTCASHLTIVSIYFGAAIIMYIWPTKTFSSSLKYISLVFGMTPGLNPLIYCLRNNEVKAAFQKILGKPSALANL